MSAFTYVHSPRTVSLFVFGFHVACLLFSNRFVGAVRTPSTLRNFSCSVPGLFSMKKRRSIPSRPFVPTRLLCSMLTSIEDFWECVVSPISQRVFKWHGWFVRWYWMTVLGCSAGATTTSQGPLRRLSKKVVKDFLKHGGYEDNRY